MKKKLCIVVDLFPPKYKGGTEMIVLEMAKEFSKTYDVHVVTKWHKRLKENKKINFKIHAVKVKNKNYSIRFINTIGPFLEKIEKINPDIIYARPFTPSGLISIIYSKKHNTPVVTQCEGGDVRSNWLNFYEKIIVNYVIKNSTKIISATNEMKLIMEKKYHRKDVIVIPNGINVEEFKKAKSIKLNYPRPRILFIGRMDEMKGTEYLIRAFTNTNKLKHGSLILIGDGPLKEDLEKKYKKNENIFFLGSVEHNTIPSYMKSSDVFVLPSIDEAQGVVLSEALASGMPIVASNVGGIPELIKKENGILTKPKDYKSIEKAIIKILTNKKDLQKMKINNKKKADKLSWKNICTEYSSIFNKLINES